MERIERMENANEKTFSVESVFTEVENQRESAGRPGPTWRALVVSIVMAIALSAMATLLLGGSFGIIGRSAPAGFGPGSACCPIPGDGMQDAAKR